MGKEDGSNNPGEWRHFIQQDLAAQNNAQAVERLGAYFSSDPELDKPHPLHPYKPTLFNRLDRSLMSESLYDTSVEWTESEEELARRIGVYAVAFLIVFGLWLGLESNSRALKPTEPFSTTPPTYMSPREDTQDK